MTTNYEFKHADYSSVLIQLKDETLLLPEEWSVLYSQTQWALERECHEIFRQLYEAMDSYRGGRYDFMASDPTKLTVAYENMPLTLYKHFSSIYPKAQRLVELQGYLKELKQLT